MKQIIKDVIDNRLKTMYNGGKLKLIIHLEKKDFMQYWKEVEDDWGGQLTKYYRQYKGIPIPSGSILHTFIIRRSKATDYDVMDILNPPPAPKQRGFVGYIGAIGNDWSTAQIVTTPHYVEEYDIVENIRKGRLK